MERKPTPDELRRLNELARSAINATPPSTGITSSAEELALTIDNIAMQTLNVCADRAIKFHIKTRDLLAAVIDRLQGTPTK